MTHSTLLLKLVLVAVLVTGAVITLPQPADALQICAMACTRPSGSCHATYCRCDAEGGAVVRCTECSDNDYQCIQDCFWNGAQWVCF